FWLRLRHFTARTVEDHQRSPRQRCTWRRRRVEHSLARLAMQIEVHSLAMYEVVRPQRMPPTIGVLQKDQGSTAPGTPRTPLAPPPPLIHRLDSHPPRSTDQATQRSAVKHTIV